MGTVEFTADNFVEKTSGEGITFIDFWADWCGPCKRFAPTYERAAEANPDITFGKVDTEAQQELAAMFQIQSIPTIMAIRDDVVVYSEPGAMPDAAFTELIKKVREIDPERLKAAKSEHEEHAHKAP
ncbi:thioredoxin domain-containing protein [Catellatospora sp. KI3]|uniref:thioredoxin family protein n=1 Tax=Catellatospora sp. KI3 TaxID=3041620 RepID=UPI0024824A96|nr:thioredoxin domain-containing protein [Catellatospora sp. KI3]MDI1460042.1 thioredoxin domain-containing protein [Catellatospora sp. KI3]